MDQRVIQLLIDSFGQILLPGLTMTIPLTVISFSLAMVIAIITALVQFANIPVLKQIARFYIWVVRGTPLLVQLFVVFYGLPDIGIVLMSGYKGESRHEPQPEGNTQFLGKPFLPADLKAAIRRCRI